MVEQELVAEVKDQVEILQLMVVILLQEDHIMLLELVEDIIQVQHQDVQHYLLLLFHQEHMELRVEILQSMVE